MRFLVDQAVLWQVAAALVSAGHDAIHVRDIGMADAADEDILRRAVADQCTIVTQDTDFGTLLAASRATSPSVVLLRMADGRPSVQATAILSAMDSVAAAIASGAIVVIGDAAVRVRSLPIGGVR